MQTAAKEALDISGESEATRRLYGLDDPMTREYGTRCLIARRLVERGVRFVQIFINGQIWDNHEAIAKNLVSCCAKTDKPSAALVKDLKARGLLDSTVVHWGGEIGRLPVTAVVENLDRRAMVEILTAPKNALVKQYQKFFELEDVELEFTQDALEAVADQALSRGTGARGLRAILEEVLLGVMYDLPSRDDIGRCVIDADVVLEKVLPTLVPRTEVARTTRPRRAAS